MKLIKLNSFSNRINNNNKMSPCEFFNYMNETKLAL